MCLPSQILKYKSNLSYFCTVDVRGLSQKVKASAHSYIAKGHRMFQALLTLWSGFWESHTLQSIKICLEVLTGADLAPPWKK